MKTDLTETLIRAIQQFAEEEMNANGESFPVHERMNDLGLSDETLSEIGLAWLVPEPDEPDEDNRTEYTVVYTEIRTDSINIKAHSREEASEIFHSMIETGEFDTTDMPLLDSYFEISEI